MIGQNLDKSKRHYSRAIITLPVRILFNNKNELAANITNCSANDCFVSGKFSVNLDDELIIYIDQIGRVEASVIRADENGMALIFNVTDIRRQKIADKLTIAINQKKINANTKRIFKRRTIKKHNTFTRANGKEQRCILVDISLGGASIITNPLPYNNEEIMLNGIPGRVIHLTEKAAGIMFLSQSVENKKQAFSNLL